MLKQRARDRLFKRTVGFLVVASAIALLLFLRMYQQTAGPFKDTFRLVGTVPRADGIEVDSPVTMAGLKIGRVRNLNLTADNQVQLDLEVRTSYHDKIRLDSKAAVNKPLIGSAFVDLSMGSPSLERLADGARIPMTRSPDINDLVATLPPKLEKIDTVLVNVVSASEALKQVAREVSAKGGSLDSSLHNVQRATQYAAEAASKVNQTLTQTQKVIADSGEAVTRINGILADVQKGTARIDSVTQRVDNVLANTEKISQDFKGMTPQLAQDIPPIIESSRDTLNEADDVLRAAKNSFLLRGNLPPAPAGPLPAGTR
jgi:phospholipid/cholesterol/gamma-HCH transport system substrate-binding protein